MKLPKNYRWIVEGFWTYGGDDHLAVKRTLSSVDPELDEWLLTYDGVSLYLLNLDRDERSYVSTYDGLWQPNQLVTDLRKQEEARTRALDRWTAEFEGNRVELSAEDERTYYVTYHTDRDGDQYARLQIFLRDEGFCPDTWKNISIFSMPEKVIQILQDQGHGISGTLESNV